MDDSKIPESLQFFMGVALVSTLTLWITGLITLLYGASHTVRYAHEPNPYYPISAIIICFAIIFTVGTVTLWDYGIGIARGKA